MQVGDRYRLQCADDIIEVDRSIVELAAPRCHWPEFVGEGAPALRLERVAALRSAERHSLEGSPAPWGFFAIEADLVRVEIPDDAYAAEAMLRVAYHVAGVRRGGLLAHGCALALGQQGVAAIGPSGAGKSTLSALGRKRGLRLLTDEIVLLLPDGTVHGTPFRSDHANVGSPGGARLQALLLLEKGQLERLEPVEPAEGVAVLLSQIYASPAAAIPRPEVFRRVAALVQRAGVQRLTFRKDPAAGEFLKEVLARAAA